MVSLRRGRRALFLLLPLAGVACQRGATSRPEPRPELDSAIEAIRLDSAEAARLAAEAREKLSAQVAEGFELKLWAPEPLLIDPHAITVDDLGRVYVLGSKRSGVLRAVNRHFSAARGATLAHQSVDDLRSLVRRELAPERSARNGWLPDLNSDGSHDWRDLAVQKERLYRIQDTSGDGLADLSQVLVEDFSTEITDIVGGVLVHGGEIFVGVAPDLWRLRDRTGDGVVDSPESISHGYGVRHGFFAHGMSGVTMGPDGRVYWSIGDVGLNVVDREGRRWAYPNQGAILRANPDGSGFEVFAAGLRNVYEFAFDEYGNLITVDNDGDHRGEKERLVYLVDGSDSGWRTNWQYGKYTDPLHNRYKVWMDEGLHRPRFPGQPAHITPPIALYHDGPAGMAYNPGTALSEEWRDHFFVVSNKGSAERSSIHAFALEERGAGFELARDTALVRNLFPTGIEFGPDGALYVADLMIKVKAESAGRIWTLDTPAAVSSPLRAETRRLLAQDLDRSAERDLLRLLGHADMRVRLKGQFELVERLAAKTLLAATRQGGRHLARVHGVWGLGQLARQDARRAEPLVPLLRDPEPELRAQVAKVLGDARYAPAGAALTALLDDQSARVRFFAAEALGRIGHRAAVQPLIAMLRANEDRDVYLRHAGTLALARIGEAEPLVALADDPSPALRIAAVVALRRMRHPGVARFLADADEQVATEAARAINDDNGIEAALPELAALLEQDRFRGEALLRRAVNANFRLGTAEAARRVAAFAGRAAAPEAMREEAIAALGVWPQSSSFDRVDGTYRPTADRDPAIARTALLPLAEPLLSRGSPVIRVALAQAAGRLDLDGAAPLLLARLREDASAEVRIAALRALLAAPEDRAETAVRIALADRDGAVRRAALELTPELELSDTTVAELLGSVVERGTVGEKQGALQALGELRRASAHRILDELLGRLAAGTLPDGIQIDLAEAVRASGSPALMTRLERYQASRSADPLTAFRDALRGGNATRGRDVTFENSAAQCTLCHSFGDQGSTVGPNLAGVGSRLTREQLLQALVDPSARIAPGYGAVSLTLRGGETVSGLLREENADHLLLQTSSGQRRIARSEIARRANTPSAMPAMGQSLNRPEIRDVVEYLTTLK